MGLYTIYTFCCFYLLLVFLAECCCSLHWYIHWRGLCIFLAKLCRAEYMVRTQFECKYANKKLLPYFPHFYLLLYLFSISGGLVYSYLTFHSTSTSPSHTANKEEEELSHDVKEPDEISEKRQF